MIAEIALRISMLKWQFADHKAPRTNILWGKMVKNWKSRCMTDSLWYCYSCRKSVDRCSWSPFVPFLGVGLSPATSDNWWWWWFWNASPNIFTKPLIYFKGQPARGRRRQQRTSRKHLVFFASWPTAVRGWTSAPWGRSWRGCASAARGAASTSSTASTSLCSPSSPRSCSASAARCSWSSSGSR